MKITHHNNELNIKNIDEEVAIRGWVSKTRNLGGLLFVDVRDRNGITQVVFRPEFSDYELAASLKSEFVVYIKGIVVERESKNLQIATGEIEINASSLEILNTAETTPMIIADETDALEQTRLKYRYLDLRRPNIQNFLIKRHHITQSITNYLSSEGFINVETPMLGKSTPEGARDYLVPSRLYEGHFYALPQSPQIYKQLLMVGGIERYYQVARCFRDEDLRADRQPEFTQIDIEASFVTQEDIMELAENMMKKVISENTDLYLNPEISRITYADAMNLYGSDKPDLRFDLKINDISEVFIKTEFSVFKNVLDDNNVIKCLHVSNNADKFSRKNIEALEKKAKEFGAFGLAWLKLVDNEFNGSIAKVISEEEKAGLISKLGMNNNDLVLIVAAKNRVVNESLGAVRLMLADELDLREKGLHLSWVVDFPLFEYSEEEKRNYAAHHPFTSPNFEDLDLMNSQENNTRAIAYDMVLNGQEIGGGSIRIHNQDIQNKMFECLGFSQEDIDTQFGFFTNALKYGTPPHGGIAFGLDRIVMELTETSNIRDVIAFPKTQNAKCPMMDAPSFVSNKQLDDLSLVIKNKK